VWEPFCGGLWVTSELARRGRVGAASDASLPLISLYRASQAGWEPRWTLTREEYHAAKLLPDTHPLKAFAGFGCSFGGKWFGGYASVKGRNFASESKRSLAKSMASLKKWRFGRVDFLAVTPVPGVPLIYCDPPYAGTTEYKGNPGTFNSRLFWNRCESWAALGSVVVVSEYTGPSKYLAAERPSKTTLSSDTVGARMERLFRLG